MNKAFSIIGASGHAKVVIEIIEEMGGTVQSVIDSNPEIKTILGYAVTDQLSDNTSPVIIAIGSNSTRKRISTTLHGLFGTAIHPGSHLSSRSSIGEGTAVMAGATINSDTEVGKHCIINTNASVDHDCVISDFVHISPGASLAGNVKVGEGSHIGIGSSVIQGIHIGQWATIGAGAVVIENVPDHAVVVGVPGKIIKYNALRH
jgi:acetyltransferase EpsM